MNVDVKSSNRKAFSKKLKYKRNVPKQVWHFEAKFSMTNRATKQKFGERSMPKQERKDITAHMERILRGQLGSPWFAQDKDPAPYYVQRVLPWEELVKCERNILVHIRTSIEPRNRLKDGQYKPYAASWFYEYTAPYQSADELSNLNQAERVLSSHKHRVVKRPNFGYAWPRDGYKWRNTKKYIRDDGLAKKQGRFTQSQKSHPMKAEAVQQYLDSCITTPTSRSYNVVNDFNRVKIMQKAEHVFDIEIVFHCNLGKRTEELKTFTSKSKGPKYYWKRPKPGYQLPRKPGKHRDTVEERVFINNSPLEI